MRLRSLWLVAALGAPLVSVATTASAGENHEHVVKLSDIPAPAREALEREAKGAPIQKVEVEHEGGLTLYEGHVKHEAGEVGIVVDAK